MQVTGDQSPPDQRDDTIQPVRARRRRRRRWMWRAGALVALLMVPVVWSYVGALAAPGKDSVSERTVEWLRDNHLSGVVNWVEQINYRLHPPRQGGTPRAGAGPSVATLVPTPVPTSIPAAVPASSTPPVSSVTAPPTAPPTTTPPAPSTTTPVPPTPPVLESPASPPLANEGAWTPLGPVVAGAPGAYVTEVRPDGIHTSYLDAVVWFDPHRLAFRQFPGTFFPGAPWDRSPAVPANQQPALVAAFEGGFRPADSRGGVVLGRQTLLPLRPGAATLAIKEDGTVDVGMLGRDINVSDGYDSLRQNLDLIVDGGAPVPELATDPNRRWGFTGARNSQYVWRSGVGVTASGDVVWVGGPALSIEDLAQTLARAGAVRAMQLDINQDWVQLNTYTVGADGIVHGTKILSGMRHNDDRYLTTDSRDFIGVFARATVLP